MEQAMIPIRVSRLSDWKIYGFQWGHLRSTLDRCGVFPFVVREKWNWK